MAVACVSFVVCVRQCVPRLQNSHRYGRYVCSDSLSRLSIHCLACVYKFRDVRKRSTQHCQPVGVRDCVRLCVCMCERHCACVFLQGAKSGAPAAHSSTSQPLSLIQALRTLLHALPAARPHPAPTHAHGRHCVSYNGAAGNPWPHNQQCQTPTTHPTLPETVQWQLERLYGTLVTPLCNSTRTLSSTLRLLPTSCYAPQVRTTLREDCLQSWPKHWK